MASKSTVVAEVPADEGTAPRPGQELDLGFNVEGLAKADELNAIETFADAVALLGLEGISEEQIYNLLQWDTNPYEPVDKAALVNVPLMIIQWKFVAGNFGGYTVCFGIARLPNGTDWRVMFTDGSSTGVHAQLDALTNKRLADIDDPDNAGKALPHPQQGAFVRGGLRPSDYTVQGPNGSEIEGRTYYLNNALKKG